uniref:methyl-CpG-binding domain-containing protein 2-like n=1 Tax=Erigeron canadensis TaxID=72917 RepID=UPI001CB93CB8|nr:methyl-CpG-binding domain-containing protein 2-like [Erigeron canadensis]XP_043626397.1 methyl-CpG-binding domain-containing protein 2-like [Erigeron canadensis]XP_043626398.1 methyl-CpG-binding domain-containing protein 2-like [Erigeron canadensis]XP_043626399.1 methyl-CpG-binding domain-containing protein 2-like [Erigeron canadensis]
MQACGTELSLRVNGGTCEVVGSAIPSHQARIKEEPNDMHDFYSLPMRNRKKKDHENVNTSFHMDLSNFNDNYINLSSSESEDENTPFSDDSQKQLVLYDPSVNGEDPVASVPLPISCRPPPLFPRVLPSIGAFTVQCARCFKWRLVPTQEKYEEIREHITENPFVCETALEWRPDVSCDDPADIEQDGSRLWAIDKPNIAQPPSGWHRELRIRGEGSLKFADIYYTSPTGSKLRSIPDIEKYLFKHPEYVAQGVTTAQFSFQTPKPLQKNYVRKRTARVAAVPDGNWVWMPSSFKPFPESPLALPDPEQNTNLQLGMPGFSTPCTSSPVNPSSKKPRKSPSNRRHGFNMTYNYHEM